MTRYKWSSAKKATNQKFFADFALKFIGQLKNECQQQGEGFGCAAAQADQDLQLKQGTVAYPR